MKRLQIKWLCLLCKYSGESTELVIDSPTGNFPAEFVAHVVEKTHASEMPECVGELWWKVVKTTV